MRVPVDVTMLLRVVALTVVAALAWACESEDSVNGPGGVIAEDGASTGGGDTQTATSDVNAPDVAGPDGAAVDTGSPDVAVHVPVMAALSGLVRQPNGLPVEGATVTLVPATVDEPLTATTDVFGAFGFEEADIAGATLRVDADDFRSLILTELPETGALAVSLALGEGEVEHALPAPPELTAEAVADGVVLTWTGVDGGSASRFRMMSAAEAPTLLDACVGLVADPAARTLIDPNVPVGPMSYRVYAELETPAGELLVGSAPVTVDVPEETAFPPLVAFIMTKTAPNADGGIDNKAVFALTTRDISADVGTGRGVGVRSAMLSEDPQQARYVGADVTQYKGNEHYFYGNPAIYAGPTRKLDEWDTKYAQAAQTFEGALREGSHTISVDGTPIRFEDRAAMPDSALTNVRIERIDGTLYILWDMTEDGEAFAGGAGGYGWRYLAKVFSLGRHATGEDPNYETELFWTNWSIFDPTRNIGFDRVCELATNMPQDHDRIAIPDGIFEPGRPVTVLLYAIATAESHHVRETGVEGVGKAWLYWLFGYAKGAVLPD